MAMALTWTLISFLCTTYPVQAVGLSEASFVSAESGENVTLRCKIKEKSDQSVKSLVWYKQSAGQEPQAVKLTDKLPNTSSEKFKINQWFDLTIEHTNETDEGMYFCGKGDGNTITFSKGTFLAMKGQPQLNISVLQTPVGGSGRKQQGSSAENTTNQTAESLNYAPIHFKENKPKPGRVKREQPEDTVYAQVRSSNAKAHRSHR
ncbi:hypothetical protein SRHO_G00125110 [Serrasalmus rhombeus]